MDAVKDGARAVLKGLHVDGKVMRVRDRQLARRAAKRAPRRMAPDGMPIPPDELISQVAGPLSAEVFLNGGAMGRRTIAETLARNGVAIDEVGALLDFGIGCGRVARHWQGIPAEVHGADYNESLVAWCQENLPHVQAVANRLEPPLPFPDARFDLVYALSVFTHLTDDQQRSWIKELGRVTRPGGHVLFTTHGPTFPHSDASFRTPEIQARLAQGELIVFEPGHAGRNYCAALHPHSWVLENMLDGFELIDYVERGADMNGGQDLYLLRRL
ncbi:MAG TPA: class I SAM-dependent methyltransferase [Baekduia sp.]|jgi:SAM-dependent methyltransferase|nr:class I SAM-dependent methyltransferase [Baekduia sp.]